MNSINWLEEWTRGTLRDPLQHFRYRSRRRCTCCGYKGKFVTSGWSGSVDFRCPNCSSRPRDRLVALLLDRTALDLAKVRFLHIAPEWPLFRRLKHSPNYVGGDIIQRRNRNSQVDITNIQFPNHSFDVVMANHVLEHVKEDRKAMKECFRVLAPGGVAFFSVPINGRKITWEPPEDMTPEEVERMCGWDHVRNYGLDLVDRLKEVGFEVTCESESQTEAVEHSLLVDDVIFVCRKNS
jgi:SAM-dependent methyltransferase